MLHVTFASGATANGPLTPRRYTLTHSDATGDLFLTIGTEYDRVQIAGWYTRLMRDEVLAEWQAGEPPVLHVHCHVSGGLVFGTAGWRASIFRQHMPMVLQAFRRVTRGCCRLSRRLPGRTSRCIFMPGRSGWPQSSRGGFSGTTGRRFFRKSAPYNEQNLAQFNQ